MDTGCFFDQDMSFNMCINKYVSCFLSSVQYARIRNILTQSNAEELAHAFITSRVDYGKLLI